MKHFYCRNNMIKAVIIDFMQAGITVVSHKILDSGN